jgi:TatD DNase family protein
MLIDTHCHLTSPELAPRVASVLAAARAVGVTRAILVAVNAVDTRAGLDLVRKFPALDLVVGIHPHEAGKCGADDCAFLREVLAGQGPAEGLRARIVGVGETGLDLHYDFAPPARQEEVFRAHLELAIAAQRPVVIHARESEVRVCQILAEYPALAGRVVFHCFSADPDVARRALDLGCYLSFTGVVTFKKAEIIRASARLVPGTRIMVETDAPYLAPEPMRKIRPNEPALLVHTARYLAEIRNERYEDFAAATTANAVRFFGLVEE